MERLRNESDWGKTTPSIRENYHYDYKAFPKITCEAELFVFAGRLINHFGFMPENMTFNVYLDEHDWENWEWKTDEKPNGNDPVKYVAMDLEFILMKK